MLRNRICYIIYLLVLLLFSLLYDEYVMTLVFVVSLLLPVVGIFQVRYSRKWLHCQLMSEKSVVSKGEPLTFRILLSNDRPFVSGRVRIQLLARDFYSDSESCQVLQKSVFGREQETSLLEIKMPHCGMLGIFLTSVRLCDSLGLFSCAVTSGCSSIELLVMPRFHTMKISPYRNNPFYHSEDEIYSNTKPGDDPAELFGVRAYEPGDKLNRIHWNLTAKQDEVMVKQFGLPLDCSALLLVELSGPRNGEGLLAYELVIEACVCISQALLEDGHPHFIAWFQPDTNSDVRMYVTSEEDLYEALGFLFHIKRYDFEQSVLDTYFENHSHERYANIYYVSTSLSVQRRRTWSAVRYDAYCVFFHTVKEKTAKQLDEAQEKQLGIKEQMLCYETVEEDLNQLIVD